MYPVGDYYVLDNDQNGFCDGDGAKLNEKKKKSFIYTSVVKGAARHYL